mmetsp:Transcript_53096/g.172622  ORF Transcript_53096/g.172622 Transcript_53096/m.172622 type:complete len:92 (+) Transcript_53096:498-773(+)
MQQGEGCAVLEWCSWCNRVWLCRADFVVQTVLLMPQHARCFALLTARQSHAIPSTHGAVVVADPRMLGADHLSWRELLFRTVLFLQSNEHR